MSCFFLENEKSICALNNFTAGLSWAGVSVLYKYTLNFHSSGGKIDFPFSPSGPGTPLNPSRPGLPGNPLCPFSPILLESRPGLPFN